MQKCWCVWYYRLGKNNARKIPEYDNSVVLEFFFYSLLISVYVEREASYKN